MDVRPLFQGNQEDNLSDTHTDPDSLWTLFDWLSIVKENKLNRVEDTLARNLLTQMLSKDPSQRPTMERILAHPFVSGV